MTAFDAEGLAVLGGVEALITARMDQIEVSLVSDMRLAAADDARRSAEKESWRLFRDGVSSLKKGSLGDAVSRASLRSSPFAASLGIKPPLFEQIYATVGDGRGWEAALFSARRLIEAAEGDIPKSHQVMQQMIHLETPLETASREDILLIKKQITLSMNMLVASYADVCKIMRKELAAL